MKKIDKAGSTISLIFLPIFIGVDILRNSIPFISFHIPDEIYSIPAFYVILSAASIYEILYFMHYRESSDLSPSFLEQFGLSLREKEVLEFLISGISYKEIAEKLFISHSTVKTHISNIYRKIGVSNKVEIINKLR